MKWKDLGRKVLNLKILPGNRPGWKTTSAICLLFAGAGVLMLDQVVLSNAHQQSNTPGPNFSRLMKKMNWRQNSPTDTPGMGMRERLAQRMAPGTPAPYFTLPAIHGADNISLSTFRGKPLVLLFGSLSCDVFCGHSAELERLHQTYKYQVGFLFVNVTEAGHAIQGLEFLIEGVNANQAIPAQERCRRTAKAMALKGLTMPAVLDVAEAVEEAYDAYPLRLVIVDAYGRITLDLGSGLFDSWNLEEVDLCLRAQAEIVH